MTRFDTICSHNTIHVTYLYIQQLFPNCRTYMLHTQGHKDRSIWTEAHPWWVKWGVAVLAQIDRIAQWNIYLCFSAHISLIPTVPLWYNRQTTTVLFFLVTNKPTTQAQTWATTDDNEIMNNLINRHAFLVFIFLWGFLFFYFLLFHSPDKIINWHGYRIPFCVPWTS